MTSILQQQYDFVCDSRKALLAYCATLSQGELVQEIPDFGNGSIRNLLIHNANVYQFWIGKFALRQEITFAKAADFFEIKAIQDLYEPVAKLFATFLQKFENQLETPIINKNFSGDKSLEISPLQLFTHVITHEFHHKGQILSMSRHLGYTPPDTDVIR